MLALAIVAGLHLANHLALHDDLTAHIALGLEQHRVHMHAWLQPACQCLKRLRSSDFPTIGGDGSIVGHILWLERRDLIALPF